jgi:hypothetical protein
VEHLRIDESKVGRADGIQEQAQAEDELKLPVFIQAFILRDNFLPYT